ncbi:MAG: (Fe-S)-binding protein [Candidatus Lokiarchaeota archaeon]|nr:(Fe-S)-binding protein [Candidatus Lokiarchaeota archaeon]
MNPKDEIIQQLKQIINENQVLTDLVDLYVYSFEKIFLNQLYPKPDVVVRTSSIKEERDVLKLGERENVVVIKRGHEILPLDINSSDTIILLDNVNIPSLESCTEEIGGKEVFIKDFHELIRSGHGTYRNFALAVQNLLFGKTLSKCQNCITCTGYCTVSPSFNGIETWSSKGRMLIAKGITKGELTFSEKIIDTLFTCTKCGLCYAQCFQNLEFHEVILYLRHLIAEKNLTPQIFHTTANNIFEHGDPAAIPVNRRLLRIKNITNLNLPQKANILCWLGCTVATRTPKTAEAFINILNRGNNEFTMLGKNEGCCGYVLISSGLWEEAKKVAIETIERIEKTEAKLLVTPCSGCYYTFTRLYPEILDVNLPCKILHSSQFLEKKIKNEKIKLKPLDINVSYHDPCSLGRHSNIYDPPRNVLKAIPNLNLIEMPLNKNCARCCGGGGGLWTFNNQVSLETTETRLKEDFIPLNVNILTTACPQCQLNFRFAARTKNLTPNSFKIYDITEIFEKAMQFE